jgi:hypothetical protein
MPRNTSQNVDVGPMRFTPADRQQSGPGDTHWLHEVNTAATA